MEVSVCSGILSQLGHGCAGLKSDFEKEVLLHDSSWLIVAIWITLQHQAHHILLSQRSHQNNSETVVRQAQYLS
jgi:hypothetical protein